MKKILNHSLVLLSVGVLFTVTVTSGYSQTKVSTDELNLEHFIHDLDAELNSRKPYGEHRYYVIVGGFKQLSNARAFRLRYEQETGNKVFIFLEAEKYYVAADGPMVVDDAKALAARLNGQAETKALSGGQAWVFKKD